MMTSTNLPGTSAYSFYCRIMVLEQGRIKEFDNPSVLMANPQSAFYAMCRDAGLVSNDNNGASNSQNGVPDVIPKTKAGPDGLGTNSQNSKSET